MIEATRIHTSKAKLLKAAIDVFRAKGYTATRIEDVCEYGGLTKGSFFHHFKSKEDLALAAAKCWDVNADALFMSAPYQSLPDPLARLFAYVDLRIGMLQGEFPAFTCFAGTLVQEVYETHPEIRDACGQSITGNVAMLEADIAQAMQLHGIAGDWSAASLARYAQTVIQGAFIMAKAHNDKAIAKESLEHFKRYLKLLFEKPQT
jgi:TetR/AcrR family transcriptional regulator, transcriptional repressor for nem operon